MPQVMSSDHKSEMPRGTAAALIRVEEVTKRFGAVVALDGASLELPEGAFFSLLGPSGCGKTTLLMILAGLERPTDGRVLLDGKPIDGVPPERRPFNLVFQSYALFPHLNVAENLAFGPRRRIGARRRSTSGLASEIAEVLQLVDLEGYERRMPGELSGGQAQRVALARALINRPRLLLLDEPMAALDRNVRHAVREQLLRIHAEVGTTFLLVTHDQEEALSVSSRIALMERGVVRQVADPETLYRRPGSLFAARFVGAGAFVPALVGAPRGDRIEAQVGSMTFLPWCATARPRTPGTILLRPEEVRLVGPGDDGLPGRVAACTFLGQSTEVVVDTELGPVRLRSDRAPTVDEPVKVAWDEIAGVAYSLEDGDA